MLDEEKKAIEFIKSELQDEKVRVDYQMLTGLYGNLEIEILLNLIEKQSKEIEELKENNRKYIVQLTDEQYRKLVDVIRAEINKEWIEKINFKIEELDETKQYWNNEVIKILNDIKGDEN